MNNFCSSPGFRNFHSIKFGRYPVQAIPVLLYWFSICQRSDLGKSLSRYYL